MQLETLDATVRDYIKELIAENQRLKDLEIFKYKYLELKERYDALMYKKYVRSAEELRDDKQHPLFEEEEEPSGTDESEARELIAEELQMLLSGIDFFKAHKEVYYKKIA